MMNPSLSAFLSRILISFYWMQMENRLLRENMEEICVRGAGLALGFFQNPEKTAHSMDGGILRLNTWGIE